MVNIRVWVERGDMSIPLRVYISTHINKLKEGCYIYGKYLIDITMVLRGKTSGTEMEILEVLGTICNIQNGICADFDVEITK